MKITILMPLAEQRGGAEAALLDLLEYGRDGSVHWNVIFFGQGPMVEQARAFGIQTCVIETGHLRELHRMGAAIPRLAAQLRRNQADAVLSWMGKPHLYGCWAAALARIPALWYQHGLPKSTNRMDRLLARLPTQGILACSKMVVEAQKRLNPKPPMRVVYPGVHLERFDPERLPAPPAVRLQLGLPTQGPLIGIVGRMQRWKGIHTLIEAMPAVLSSFPDAHCVVVGGAHDLEPDYPGFLEAQIRRLGLSKQITLAGLQRNVPEWMQAMDVVVHASDREPFGIVVIEALALNKPVIAGSEGGPAEIITPERHGLLAPYGDAVQLAAAIRRTLQDPAEAARRAALGRARAQDFSTRHYARNVICAVQELCSPAPLRTEAGGTNDATP